MRCKCKICGEEYGPVTSFFKTITIKKAVPRKLNKKEYIHNIKKEAIEPYSTVFNDTKYEISCHICSKCAYEYGEKISNMSNENNVKERVKKILNVVYKNKFNKPIWLELALILTLNLFIIEKSQLCIILNLCIVCMNLLLLLIYK